MNGVSNNSRPLPDSVNAPDSVMKPETVMGPVNKQFSSSDYAPQTAISSTNATADSSSWMSPVTSLFTPNANQSAHPDKNDDHDDSWMPSMKDDGNNDNDFAPEPPLHGSPDMDVGANEGNKSFMSPTSMFSPQASASSSGLDAESSGMEAEPSGDVGGLFGTEEPTPKKQNYFSELVSGMQWGFDWVSIVKYVVILILLALMGLNVFSYLGDASDGAATLLERISNLFSGITADLGKGIKVVVRQTTKTTADGTKAAVDMAAGGTKGVVNVTAGAIDSGVNVLEQQLEKNGRTAADSRASASANTSDPVPDMVGNVTQSGGTGTGKSGYCYIGEDRGFRSCVKVGQMDQCMSGDIFPTEAICINPNLRE